MVATLPAQHRRDWPAAGGGWGCAAHRGTGASAAAVAAAARSGPAHTAVRPRAAAGARAPRPAGSVRPFWEGGDMRCELLGRLVGVGRWVESNDIMTYYGGLLRCCVVRRRDVIGIAHGEESIDRALLVATHRVDDGVPIRYEQGKIDHISRSSRKCVNDGGVVYISSQNGRIEIRKDRVQLGYLGICKLIDGQL